MLTGLLFSALLATSIGQSIVITLLPSLGRAAGLTEIQVALILSTSSLVFALGASIWSGVCLKLGRRKVLLIGMSGYTLGTLIFTFVFYLGFSGWLVGLPLVLALLLARSLQSSVMSATPPAVLGITLAISTPENRVGRISRVTSANTLGQVIGPAMGGLLAIFGLLVPLYTIILFTFLAWILMACKLPPESQLQTDEDSKQKAQPDEPLSDGEKSFFANNPGLHYVVIAAALFCALAMVHQTLGFYFMDELGKTPQEAAQRVGFAAMTVALVSFVVQFILIQRLQLASWQLLIPGLIALTLGLVLLALVSSPQGIYLAMSLIGLGMGFSYPAATAGATTSGTAKQQNRNTGMVSAAPALGFIVGPLLAALVYQLEPHYPFVLASTIIASLLLIHCWRSLISRRRPSR